MSMYFCVPLPYLSRFMFPTVGVHNYLQKQVFSRCFAAKSIYILNLGNRIKGQIFLLICPTLYI